jgi:hypothetical protein
MDAVVASSPDDSLNVRAGGATTGFFRSEVSGNEVAESGSSEDFPISSSSDACSASSWACVSGDRGEGGGRADRADECREGNCRPSRSPSCAARLDDSVDIECRSEGR